MKIKDCLKQAQNLGIDILEAEILLAETLKKDRSYLYTYPENLINDKEYENFCINIKDRAQGLPIAYITKEREFWSLILNVSPDILIPRHETELLVEIALGSGSSFLKVLELGTGSGAIAIALASERPNWQITATDKSLSALAIAKSNAEKFSLQNIKFLHSDWFNTVEGKYDIIISNPPYIENNDPHLKQGDLRFEPQLALASGPDGLDALKLLISQSQKYLNPQGLIILEHGYNQGKIVAALLDQHNFTNIKKHLDLSQHHRASSAVIK